MKQVKNPNPYTARIVVRDVVKNELNTFEFAPKPRTQKVTLIQKDGKGNIIDCREFRKAELTGDSRIVQITSFARENLYRVGLTVNGKTYTDRTTMHKELLVDEWFYR